MGTKNIYRTANYDAFKWLHGNRNLSERHVEEIMESISANGWLTNPIKVNEKMEIVDGQHRFEACKRLGLPIEYFIACYEPEWACRVMNDTQNGWCGEDRLVNEAALGDETSKALISIAKQNPKYKSTVIYESFTKLYTNTKKRFKVVMVDDMETGYKILECLDALKDIGCKPGTGTVRAVKIMSKFGVRLSLLTDAIRKKGARIIGEQSIATTGTAYILLTKVYNLGRKGNYIDFPPYGSKGYKQAAKKVKEAKI